jgi:hypothetical protein
MRLAYNGSYPNLCSGSLIVWTDDGKEWQFPSYCLKSGGRVWFDKEWNDHTEHGLWSVKEWPDDFPDSLKSEVLDLINKDISHGCCGGCV